MRVLVTRPEPGASETAKRLEALGFEPVVLPLTETQAIPVDLATLPPAFDAVAVTSANAIRHAPLELIARLSRRRCFAVGERTAEAARASGLADLVTGNGNAEGLARLMKDVLPPGTRLVYLCGRVRRPEFEAALAGSGISVTPVEVYDTVDRAPAPDVAMRLTGARLDAALVYSVKSADVLACMVARPELVQTFEDTRYFCLSPRIASALKGIPPSRIHVSTQPSEESLFVTLGRT